MACRENKGQPKLMGRVHKVVLWIVTWDNPRFVSVSFLSQIFVQWQLFCLCSLNSKDILFCRCSLNWKDILCLPLFFKQLRRYLFSRLSSLYLSSSSKTTVLTPFHILLVNRTICAYFMLGHYWVFLLILFACIKCFYLYKWVYLSFCYSVLMYIWLVGWLVGWV